MGFLDRLTGKNDNYDRYDESQNIQENETQEPTSSAMKDIQGINMNSRIKTLEDMNRTLKRQFDELVAKVEVLCKKILDTSYTKAQLGGGNILNNINVFKLMDMTSECYLKEKEDYNKSLQMLHQQIIDQNTLIKNLQAELKNAIIQNSRNKDIQNLDSSSINLVDTTSHLSSEPVKDNSNILKSETQDNAPVTSLNKPSDKTLVVEFLSNSEEKITEIMWDIISCIAEKGMSRSTYISDTLEKIGKGYNKTTILQTISTIEKMNLIKKEKITTGYVWFFAIELTEKGIEIWERKTGKKPVMSEIESLIRDHDNAQHGYTITVTKEILMQFHDCKEVEMDRAKTRTKLPNNKEYIPDIIAIKQNGEKMYVEVELGTTITNEFNDKMDKMLQVTNTIHIVTDVEDTLKKKLDSQIAKWVLTKGGKDAPCIKGLTVKMTTTTQLAKMEWAKEYHF